MTPLWQREPVGVVGLGLIGGSLGLDLMAMGAQVRALVHRPATAARAAQRGLANEVSTDPVVLEGCGLVLLALPLDRLLNPEPALVAALPGGAVITDVGSVKGPVLRRWRELLAGAAGGGLATCRFVASHPMAGTARAGVEAGEPGLFRGRPWVATPEADTDPAALEAVRELAEALGARWLCCDAESHDRAVALISHLPVLVGAALLQAADVGGGAAGGDEAGEGAEAGAGLVRALASSGFADTTRVGGGNPELGMLMARANRAALLEALGHYRHSMASLEAMVAGEQWSDLQQSLELSHRLRPDFL